MSHPQPTPAHPQPRSRWRAPLIQAALVVGVLLWLAWRAQPDGQLHVIFLQTAGDAALIQTPGGQYVLIDGGGDPTAITAALGRRLPFWRRSLDAVVLTALDEAHASGQVAVLARYRANLVIAPPLASQNALLSEWRHTLASTATPLHTARAGETLKLDSAVLRVLAPGDGEERGMLLRLDYGTTSVVLCQSSAEKDETALVDAGILRPATLVAFPWQRDPPSGLLAALRPRAIVLTDGFASDRPFEATLKERRIGNEALYHEELNGTIEWISDGRRSRIVTDR